MCAPDPPPQTITTVPLTRTPRTWNCIDSNSAARVTCWYPFPRDTHFPNHHGTRFNQYTHSPPATANQVSHRTTCCLRLYATASCIRERDPRAVGVNLDWQFESFVILVGDSNNFPHRDPYLQPIDPKYRTPSQVWRKPKCGLASPRNILQCSPIKRVPGCEREVRAPLRLISGFPVSLPCGHWLGGRSGPTPGTASLLDAAQAISISSRPRRPWFLIPVQL